MKPTDEGSLRLARRIVPAIFLLAAAALLLFGADRGFDLTDEAYYLAWIADPAGYAAMIHPFGIFYHPLWALAPSVTALRLAGFVLAGASATVLGWWAAGYYRALGLLQDRLGLALLATLGGLAGYVPGLRTPNYNILADAGAALMAAGLFGWATKGATARRDAIASLLVGTGAWIAFLGKPTFAALAALAVTAALVAPLLRSRQALGRSVRRASIVAVGCFVPLLAMIESTVSLSGFVAMVGTGLPVLDFGNSLPHLLFRAPRDLYQAPSFLIAAAMAALFTLVLLARTEPDASAARRLRPLNAAMLACALASLPIEIWRGALMEAPLWMRYGASLIAAALAFAAFGAASRPGPASRPAAAIPLVALALLPLAIAFGSANPWFGQTGASLFAIILVVALAGRLYFPGKVAALVDAGACAGVLVLLVTTNLLPYRLPASLYAQDRPVSLPFAQGEIRVDARTEASLATFAAAAPGVPPGTPIIDLSNSGPGPVMLLRGRAPFFPWLNANYPNAVSLADAVWASLSPQEQQGAWFIGPAVPALGDSQPARFLARHLSTYRLAASLPLPDGRRIELWRPLTPPVSLNRD